jgi:hypothetical protein
MPAYQNVTPPISLMPGDVGFCFNNEAFPGSATAGSDSRFPATRAGQTPARLCAGKRFLALRRPP